MIVRDPVQSPFHSPFWDATVGRYGGTPSYALVDRQGNLIVTRAGEYIIAAPTRS